MCQIIQYDDSESIQLHPVILLGQFWSIYFGMKKKKKVTRKMYILSTLIHKTEYFRLFHGDD